MNLNLSVEQLEVVSTLLWRAEKSLMSANWILDKYKGDPEEGGYIDHEAVMSAATVTMERQLMIQQIMKTIESEVGLQIDFNTSLQRCELVNKAPEASHGTE